MLPYTYFVPVEGMSPDDDGNDEDGDDNNDNRDENDQYDET